MSQIEIELDVPAVMRDGTILRADVYRPTGDGPWPVLIQRTPYFKGGGVAQLGVIEAAQRGYIVVHQDTRGRGSSEGEWLPWAHEREDGYDTIEWAAQLPGSDGRVGMIGSSYTGSTQWSAAITQPPSLVAIAPMVTWADPADGVMFRGGATELGLNSAWGLIQSLTGLDRSGREGEELLEGIVETTRAYDELATRTYWELPSGAQPSVVATRMPDIGVARALEDPSTMDECRVVGNHDRVTVPSLILGGWYDIFQQGPLDNYRAMRERGVPTHLVMGPWHHYSLYGGSGGQTGEVNFGSGSLAPPAHGSLNGLQLDWYDHWMKDAPATELHGSGVDLFVMGRNEWRREEAWPLARAQETPLYLQPDGQASFVASDADRASSDYVYDPHAPVTTRGGSMLMVNEFPPGPTDQRPIEGRDDVLVFTTPPLENDLEVTGNVRATLFVETDAPSTDWVVRLCDVAPDGTSLNIVDGILRTSTTPGEVEEIEVDLWSTSMVFRAGHRLRVHVTSSSFPRWDRNFNTGEPVARAVDGTTAHQRVHHDRVRASALRLPVVPD